VSKKGNKLRFSTYLGGSDRYTGMGIAVDKKGSAYVVGSTNSLNFPPKNPIQKSRKVTWSYSSYSGFKGRTE